MSRSKKPEKGGRKPESGHRHGRVHGKPESKDVGFAISQRHQAGSTEKILRRNRKTWTRLANKRRRALDKKAVEDE